MKGYQMRINRFCLSGVFGIFPLMLFAQLNLSIEISGLKNNEGQIHLELRNEREETIAAASENLSGLRCVIVIRDLEPGKYSFKYFHDANNNKVLDTNWLGIPKEGFGFSNDPGISFGPPPSEKILFELNETTVLTTSPKYF